MGLGLTLAGASGAVAAVPAKKVDTSAQRLNMAEQQEMLVERLSRTWAMKGIDVVRPRATAQFEEDSKRFARQLKTLQTDADTPELKDTYAQMEQLWDKYAQLAEASASRIGDGDSRSDPNSDLPPTAFIGNPQNKSVAPVARVTILASLKDISDQNEKLVATAAKGSDLLAKRIGVQQSEGLRLAGQARTLSQRMAKLYFFRSLGTTAPFVATDMKKAETGFLQSIKRLRELSEDRPRTVGIISLVDQQWMFFTQIIQSPVQREDRDQAAQTLARTSDSLLSALDDLCKNFEQ
jgi:hypothetical protein